MNSSWRREPATHPRWQAQEERAEVFLASGTAPAAKLFRLILLSQMKKIIYVIGYLLYATKLYKFVIFLRRYNKKILVYHNINDSTNPFIHGMNITTSHKAFEQHMIFLAKHYTVVDLETIIVDIEKKKKTQRLVSITFDDGYVSFLDNAYPILNRFRYPSTVFIIGKCISPPIHMWSNVICYLLNQNEQSIRTTYRNISKYVNANVRDNADIKPLLSTSSLLEFTRNSTDIAKVLKPTGIEWLIRNIEDQVDIPKIKLYLTVDECKKLSGNGVDFGNHSYSHYDFSYLTIDDIEHEITATNLNLLKDIDYKSHWLALPFGRPLNNQRLVEQIARRNKIQCIFFSNGLDNAPSTSLYRLGRHHLISEREYRIFTEMELLPFFRKVRDRLRMFLNNNVQAYVG